jgi:sigma-B regulation protein RsbU (phosphoserine phosphatase)
MMTDVCGHGVKPALLAVALHYVLDNRFQNTPSFDERFPAEDRGSVVPPADLLSRMNLQFPMDTEMGQYFTMFYGVLATDTGEFQYSTAGHPTPILIPEDGEIRQLQGTGVPVGLHSEPDFETETVVLQPGDRLFLFSDGLVESKRKNGDRVGMQRLMNWLKEAQHLDLNGITTAVSQNVKNWNAGERPDDDVSILVVEYSGKAAVTRAALQNLLQDGKTWSLN